MKIERENQPISHKQCELIQWIIPTLSHSSDIQTKTWQAIRTSINHMIVVIFKDHFKLVNNQFLAHSYHFHEFLMNKYCWGEMSIGPHWLQRQSFSVCNLVGLTQPNRTEGHIQYMKSIYILEWNGKSSKKISYFFFEMPARRIHRIQSTIDKLRWDGMSLNEFLSNFRYLPWRFSGELLTSLSALPVFTKGGSISHNHRWMELHQKWILTECWKVYYSKLYERLAWRSPFHQTFKFRPNTRIHTPTRTHTYTHTHTQSSIERLYAYGHIHRFHDDSYQFSST